jgi:hypothetical protein
MVIDDDDDDDDDDDVELKCLFFKSICPTFMRIIENIYGVTRAKIVIVQVGAKVLHKRNGRRQELLTHF